MQQTPKEKPETEDCEQAEEKRSYYYDDAHGYEDFDPEDEDEESEEKGLEFQLQLAIRGV